MNLRKGRNHKMKQEQHKDLHSSIYAWDHIHELEGKHKLNDDEKVELCKKLEPIEYKPSLILILLTKVIPFPIIVLFFVGFDMADSSVLGIIFIFSSLIYLVLALILYLIKFVWVYDRWKEAKRGLLKRDVYRVPVVIASCSQAGGKYKSYYVKLRYTDNIDFAEEYQISDKLYQNLENKKLYAYYYEGKRDKYQGKYKIFLEE